jgi:tryptophan-rich sensory protein
VNHRLALVLFLLLVAGGGVLIGWLTALWEWYAHLQKPAFNPPDWIFAPVWTVLYVLIATAGWRIWQRGSLGLADDAMVGAARAQFPVVADLLCRPPHWPRARNRASASRCHLRLIAASWRFDRVAALLFAPYAVWVAFARC